LTIGCVVLLVPLVFALVTFTVIALSFVWSAVDMNRHGDDFAAFDHVDAGSPVKAVIDRTLALGFDEEPMGRATSDRWFIQVESANGGVVRVHTSTLD
jgi:hypothetical protein